jgi:hypothetical protein
VDLQLGWLGIGQKNKLVTKYHRSSRTWKDYLDKRPQLKNGHEIWYVELRIVHRAGSLMAMAKEITNFKLDLVGIQEVRLDRRGIEPAGEYTFFYGNGNENHELVQFFVHKRIISAVKRVEFISDRMSYILLRGRWCDIIVLNVPAPTRGKIDNVKDRFYEELEQVFNKFPKYHMKILLGNFNGKVGKEDFLKPASGNESLH